MMTHANVDYGMIVCVVGKIQGRCKIIIVECLVMVTFWRFNPYTSLSLHLEHSLN